MFEPTEDELVARAMQSYFAVARKAGEVAQFPSRYDSGVEEVDQLSYVVLRNGNGVLAVYRVRNDGMLKRLKRYPAALDEAWERVGQ
jgi:hypothetical protein